MTTEHDIQLKKASPISDVKVEEKNEQVQSKISNVTKSERNLLQEGKE